MAHKLQNDTLSKHLLGLQDALESKQLVKYTLFCGQDFICEIFSVVTNKHARNHNAFRSQTPYLDSARKRGACSIHVLSVFQ